MYGREMAALLHFMLPHACTKPYCCYLWMLADSVIALLGHLPERLSEVKYMTPLGCNLRQVFSMSDENWGGRRFWNIPFLWHPEDVICKCWEKENAQTGCGQGTGQVKGDSVTCGLDLICVSSICSTHSCSYPGLTALGPGLLSSPMLPGFTRGD